MKILVAVLSSDVNHEKLEEILTEFEQRGYHIHVFDKVEEQVESMLDLPKIVSYVKELEEESVERIVVLSNIREYIFSWYRCYNSLIDDYIYYLDEHANFKNLSIAANLPHIDFYEQLYNFNGIEQEDNQGKIYINININNFRKVNHFLLANNNFKFFEVYSKFEFDENFQKIIINKVYIYNERQYLFTIAQGAITEKVVVHSKDLFHENVLIHELCKLLKLQYHFIFYLLIAVKEIFKNDQHKCRTYLVGISTHVELNDEIGKKILYQCFNDYCEEADVSFYDKIAVASLMAAFGIKENIYFKIMELLLNDNDHIESHYSLLTNSLCYHTFDGISHYKNIFHDREQELAKIIKFYKENIVVNAMPIRRTNRIMIHATQLLTLRHSPTLLTLNYAKYLKTYYPDYEIQIFVDDMFVYHSTENTFPYKLSSALSITCRETHEEFLKELDIIIYYSDTTKERKERIKEGLEYIYEFAPELILGFSTDFSIIRGFLYDNYPIIDITVGGLSNSQNADLFIHGYEQSYIEQECIKYDYNLENLRKGKMLKCRVGVDFPEPIKNIKREEYDILKEDFVMVTVGNRLDAEMSDQFIDMICSFLHEKPRVKWVIVGKAELIYLKSNYSNLINKQIIFIKYENDLAALYRLCDIYINPFREHGGYSAGMAMNQSLPVITLNIFGDVAEFVGIQNSVVDSIEYLHEMQRLYEDRDYKEIQGKLMKKRIDEYFSFKHTIDDIVKNLSMTINEFNKRIYGNVNQIKGE